MKHLLHTLLAAFVLWLCQAVAAQGQERTVLWLDDNLEELLEADEGANWDDEIEELQKRLVQPVNLNTATREQLRVFPFLDETQIENILSYIYLHGPMQTIYELQLVEDMDKRTIELLLPFIAAGPSDNEEHVVSLGSMLKYGRHEVLTRLGLPFYRSKGYETKYLGTPQYHSLRYGFRYSNRLQVGLTAEKDAGEPLFAQFNQRGYDHYGFHFMLRDAGALKVMALGNYKLNFGMGLVMNNTFSMGKSFTLSTVQHTGNNIRAHASTDEYNYLSGAAATVALTQKLSVSGFASDRRLDATLKDDAITSISKTGQHRTETEADRRNSAHLRLAGGNINWRENRFNIGFTGVYYAFDHSYEPSLTGYARYNLHGKSFYNMGLDYEFRLGRLSMAGEAAKGTKGYATVNRLSYRLSNNYRLLLLHRYYTYDYWAFYGRSFSDGSTPQNENGWYVAAEATPLPHWHFFASADFFSHPWWKYRISKPSKGIDLMFKAQYAPTGQTSMYLTYRFKRKERDVSGTSGSLILPTRQHKWRYRLLYTAGPVLLRSTADYVLFTQQHTSQGYALTQMVGYTPTRLPLTVTLQGTYFHTDDYDSRVFVSEKALLYTFYSPSFSGRGWRFALHAQCELASRLTLLAKLGHTLYPGRESIGTGNDQTLGSSRTDLQLQLRLKM